MTHDRDHLQEELKSISWEREEGEGEEEEGEEGKEEEEEGGEEGERRETMMSKGSALHSQRNIEALQRISLVEEMNIKASNGVKETKLKAKVYT